MRLYANTRMLSHPITGVQRYLLSILQHTPADIEVIRISANAKGIKGHLWEQLVLPTKAGNNLLWSPANTGPLFVKNQLVTVHDTVFIDHPEWLNPRFCGWYRFLVPPLAFPMLARRVSKIIAVSNFTKQRVLSICKVPEAKVHVVHNGVDPRFARALESQIALARKSLGISEGQYILALATLEPRKNLRRLMQAWEGIVKSIPDDIWLVVAGMEAPKRIYASARLDSVPQRVHFTGRVPDDLLPALYSGAMITAYPSLYEGFGLPVLEAMACGCPVLTSNTTALPEVAGNAALLVNPYDVSEIADSLLKLVFDEYLRTELSEHGLKWARHFSWQRAADKTFKILRQEVSGL